jgi:hypothetical protein
VGGVTKTLTGPNFGILSFIAVCSMAMALLRLDIHFGADWADELFGHRPTSTFAGDEVPRMSGKVDSEMSFV